MKDRSSYPSEQADKFLLRMPDGMRDKVARRARENGRSMNAEIVWILQYFFDRFYDAPAKLMQKSRSDEVLALIRKMLNDEIDEAGLLFKDKGGNTDSKR